MPVSEIIGFFAAILIGLVLGVNGSGGSILAVPILVYLFGKSTEEATSYSLLVVGITSAIGSAQYARNGLLRLSTAVRFAIPSVTAALLTRLFLVSLIPDTLFTIGSFSLTKNAAMLVLFAGLMIWAALAMLKTPLPATPDTFPRQWRLSVQGAAVGLLTGLVGAGGGFLIIPSLVFWARTPLKQAVGASLLIISLNSLVGFLGDLGRGFQADWVFLLIFTSLTVVGILIGSKIAAYISAAKLKRYFAFFVLIMGVFIIVKETIKMLKD